MNPAPSPETDLLAPVRARLARELVRFPDAGEPLEAARILLHTGRHDEAAGYVERLRAGGAAQRLLAAEILFAVQDLGELEALLEELQEEDPPSEGEGTSPLALLYRWWFLCDDLERVEREAAARAEAGKTTVTDLLASARLAVHLFDLPSARRAYAEALSAARGDAERGRSLHGFAVVLYRERDFDAALRRLCEALDADPLEPDLLMTLANTLIRLGRIDEAIAAAELAVSIAPYHETAHYVLGNGYARWSYSQLAEKSPQAAAEAEAAVHEGSLVLAADRFAEARRLFLDALAACPAHGRAHNGLAKTLEAERQAVDVHRAGYEERFAEAEEPVIEGVEELVTSFAEISPRHRKRVALSIAPWARYVPVLLAGGASYYVKPIHQILSDVPGLRHLRDRRIGYDARLWDDVRGCGGFHTVTGVEDVERTILGGYDTVVHELSHQVHDVLPEETKRRIQGLYRRRKESALGGEDAFLSRYAAESVWEYFAEGANALATPRRDRFDGREVVRERLLVKDPELVALLRELTDEAALEPCFAQAFARRGEERLRHGKIDEAIAAFHKALARVPGEQSATSSLAFALTVSGRSEEALALAEEAAHADPRSATLALAHADAAWLAGRGLAAAVAVLAAAREAVRGEERFRVDLSLGNLLWTAGDADGALRAFAAVLDYQADNPQALWGLASSFALRGEWEKARERYAETVRRRSGLVRLRADFARDLLVAGDADGARREIDAALLLDAEDPEVAALDARWLLGCGRVEEALATARRAFELGAWCDLARLTLAEAELRSGSPHEARETLTPLVERLARETPPEYVHRPKLGSYELAHDLPAVLRRWIAAAAAEAGLS